MLATAWKDRQLPDPKGKAETQASLFFLSETEIAYPPMPELASQAQLACQEKSEEAAADVNTSILINKSRSENYLHRFFLDKQKVKDFLRRRQAWELGGLKDQPTVGLFSFLWSRHLPTLAISRRVKSEAFYLRREKSSRPRPQSFSR